MIDEVERHALGSKMALSDARQIVMAVVRRFSVDGCDDEPLQEQGVRFSIEAAEVLNRFGFNVPVPKRPGLLKWLGLRVCRWGYWLQRKGS